MTYFVLLFVIFFHDIRVSRLFIFFQVLIPNIFTDFDDPPATTQFMTIVIVIINALCMFCVGSDVRSEAMVTDEGPQRGNIVRIDPDTGGFLKNRCTT